MNTLIKIAFIYCCLTAFQVDAQTTTAPGKLVSGVYEEVKLSYDPASRNFTGLMEETEGNIGCSLFFKGNLSNNKNGKCVIKAYPFGLMDTTANYGSLTIRPDKKANQSGILIQLNESGSCQNIIDLRGGTLFTFDKFTSFRQFSMIRIKKAIAYANNTITSPKKGYFLQGDIVSIISVGNDFCYVEYYKKPSFKAWLRKADLVL